MPKPRIVLTKRRYDMRRSEREAIMRKVKQLMKTPEGFEYPTLGDLYDWLLIRNRPKKRKGL